jgi:hypothetical protein
MWSGYAGRPNMGVLFFASKTVAKNKFTRKCAAGLFLGYNRLDNENNLRFSAQGTRRQPNNKVMAAPKVSLKVQQYSLRMFNRK